MTTELPAGMKILGPMIGTPAGKMISGMCNEGLHENFVEKGACRGGCWWRGRKFLCHCACHCYARKLPPGSDFDPPKPPPPDPLRPTLAEELRQWAHDNDVKVLNAQRPVQTVTPDAVSESGRRARGALELQVLDLCERYLQNEIDWEDGEDPFLTPSVISEEVANIYRCTAPSTGAVGAVLERWEEWGLAYLARKPIRFLMFAPIVTEVGFEVARERMKDRAKHRQ